MYKIFFLISFAFIFLTASCDTNDNDIPPVEFDEKEDIENTKEDDDDDDENEEDKTKNAFLYIGTYTDSGSKGIYVSTFNAENGEISSPKLAASLNNASFQHITADKLQLWSVNESWSGPGRIHGYSIDPESGKLSSISNFPSQGNSPCYVSMHEPSGNLLTSNYSSGNVANIPVNSEGKLKGEIFSYQHSGSGPNTNRQSSPHAHCIKVDLNEHFIYSADLGADKIYCYTIEEDKLKLHKEISTVAGSGPRHIDFHPSGKAMAVVNELNSTVDIYLPDNNACFSERSSSISTLPDGFNSNNQCADIHYSSDGKFLYASNRGHNSIVVYSVNEETMELEIIEWMKESINWPRNFIIDNNQNFLLVANQNSNTISVYQRDKSSGKLTYTNNQISISKPVCLTLLEK
jgi:6-phosphogluconolactonase